MGAADYPVLNTHNTHREGVDNVRCCGKAYSIFDKVWNLVG